jgi:uracil-DNA glycosylase
MVTRELSFESSQDAFSLLSFYAENGVHDVINETPTNFLLLSKEEEKLQVTEKPRLAAALPAQILLQAQVPLQTPIVAKIIPLNPPPAPNEAMKEAENLAKAATNLVELHQALAQFTGSPLKKTAKNLIFADGNPASGLMFIGDTPKGEDDAQGRAFSGAYGELMDNMLKAIGLTRENAYLTHIIPYRPPGNRAPTPQELASFLPFALRHIALVAPKHLIILGGVATTSLLQSSENLVKIRGKWQDFKSQELSGIQTMPTFHPDYLLKHPLQKRLAYQDLLAIKQNL